MSQRLSHYKRTGAALARGYRTSNSVNCTCTFFPLPSWFTVLLTALNHKLLSVAVSQSSGPTAGVPAKRKSPLVMVVVEAVLELLGR